MCKDKLFYSFFQIFLVESEIIPHAPGACPPDHSAPGACPPDHFIGIIIWLAVRAFRRYKEQVVDPEKEHLAEENEKLRTMNRRLTERNQELAEKVSALQRRLAAGPQQSDEHWFG